ncbi:MAG: helix-turn-helix domain-containing protein [Prevotella sp.]|nr:helix-turn-helix domain-containing protein [Prevotella sp.]
MNKLLKKPLIIVYLLLSALSCLQAQEVGNFTFSHIGSADGMHSQRIYSILQTDDGALWWSSNHGIERYNGVNIKHYALSESGIYSEVAGRRIELCDHLEKDTKSLQAAQMLAFDNKGRIYAYDPMLDRFRLLADVSKLLKGLTDLNDILKTANGYWLATNKGIYFLHDDTLIPVARNYYANYIIRTHTSLLFCTRQGVLAYRKAPDQQPQADSKMTLLVPYDVESGYYDNIYNKVWLGGYSSGIRVLSEDGKQETEIGITHNPVRVIYPYDIHTMLVGIDGMGVYKVDRHPQSNNSIRSSLLFDANDGPQGVLHSNGIYTLIRDIWGNIVIGSYSGGIDIARPVGTTVAIYQHMANNQQSILNDHVNTICQSPKGNLMMGTDNGISIYDSNHNRWSHACRGSVVLHLCNTPRGTVLAATYGQGVLELTEDGQSRVLYSIANGNLQDNHVYRMFYDNEGNLWVGSLDGDLAQQTTGGTRYYPVHYVKDMLQLPDGRIAVATTYGIWLINPSTGKIAELPYAPTDEKDINRFVHTLYLNNSRELWIGTDGGGIYVYNLANKQTSHLTTHNGLPSNFVNTIYKDRKDRIIIATERGLSFVDPKDANRIIGVNYCYGVDRQYTSRSAINLTNGYMALGSTTGALVINPDHIQEINYTAVIHLMGVNYGDETVSDKLKEQISQQLTRHELKLSYRQRTFELFFESINLRNQSDIGYQYKVDKGEWSKLSTQQSIRFSSMEPGKHTLKLRSVSRTCGAILDETTLTIYISQPWWNSWWMWIIYVCLFALAFYGAWRIYQLHTKYMRLVVNDLNRSNNFTLTDSQTGTSVGQVPQDSTNQDQTKQERTGTDTLEESNQFISQATRLVIENISDSNFTIDRLCREMAMSRTLFYVKLKSYTGKSPQDFIRIIRLERAATLLRNGRQVTDVATMTGFDNPKYFSTVFKKYFGVSPSKYQ